MRKAKSGKATRGQRARRNPPTGGRIFSHEVHSIAYVHDDDGEPYEHKFAKGVTMAAASDGSIVLYRPDGRTVWEDIPQ